MNNGDFRPSYEQASLDYQAKLVKYQSELAEYRLAMERWHSLPERERASLNRQAEMESRGAWCVLLAIVVSIALYKWLEYQFHGNAFWWAFGGSTIFSWVVILALSKILGPIVRGAVFGIIGALIGLAILYFINKDSASPLSRHASEIIIGVPGLLGLLGGLLYRASAAPQKPSRPNAPQRNHYQ